MIAFDRLQAGLRQAILAADNTLTVVWSPSEYPEPAGGNLVALRVLSGPDLRGYRLEHKHYPIPTTVRVTCTNTAGSRGTIFCQGARWHLDVEPGETATEYRDRWVEYLATAGLAVDGEITPVGANAFDIAGTELISLYGFGTFGQVTSTVTASTFSDIRSSDARLRIEAQVFSGTRYLRGGAMDTAAKLVAKLGLPAPRAVLNAYGLVHVTTSPVVDLTTIAGPGWESRAAVSVDIGTNIFAAEAVESIETVTGTLTVENGTGESITQSFSEELP